MARLRNSPPDDAMPKWCNGCTAEIPPEGWYWLANGKRGTCKCCMSSWHKERYGSVEVEIKCERCGTKKTTTRTDVKFCSRKCKGLARGASLKDKRVAGNAVRTRSCANCGALLSPEKRSDAYFCSNDCMQASRNTIKKATSRITARGSDGTVHRVRRIDIYERDHWICQLCGTEVDRSGRHPNPDAPSLDHIVPVARGGTHEASNLQTTHLRCNLARGAKQLRDEGPAMMVNGNRCLTVPEAANSLGINKAVVDRWVRQGFAAATQAGFAGTRYLTLAEVERLRKADTTAFTMRQRRKVKVD